MCNLADELLHATHDGCLQACKDIIKAGVDIVSAIEQYTLLHLAVLRNQPEICKLFLQYGTDVNMRNVNYKTTPLHISSTEGNEEICLILLLQEETNVNVFDVDLRTPMHYAAQCGHLSICDILMEHRAYTDIPDKMGKTPKALAMENGFKDIAYYLDSYDYRQVKEVIGNRQLRMPKKQHVRL